jgi:hypothetical protein
MTNTQNIAFEAPICIERRLTPLLPMSNQDEENMPKIMHKYGYYVIGDILVFGYDLSETQFGFKLKSIK